MNNTRKAFIITGRRHDDLANGVTIAACKGIEDKQTTINRILENRDLFAAFIDFVDVFDDEGKFLEFHSLQDMNETGQRMGLDLINSHAIVDLVVLAKRNGSEIKSIVHHTDTALAVADHYMSLGWNVEVARRDNYFTLFDSDYDMIVDDNGGLRAVYLVGGSDDE